MRICDLLFIIVCSMLFRHFYTYKHLLSRPRYETYRSLTSDAYSYHIPVMRDECCDGLNIVKDGIYVDCTLGGGGHTKAILDRGGKVIGIDQDPDAIKRTTELLQYYILDGRLEILQTNFRYITDSLKGSKMLSEVNRNKVDGVLMDLGISSYQIDEATRGFSFGKDGPLDMRMGKNSNSNSLTAFTIINQWDATALANCLYEFGEEKRSRIIAREIIASRPLNTTGELEQVISRITHWKERSKTLARCFQALRIVVNDEINALDETLNSIHTCIRPGGRLVVLSYHSLEDRRIKQLMKPKTDNPDMFIDNKDTNIWSPVTKKALIPSESEVENNRRARSAKLRIAEINDILNNLNKSYNTGDNKKKMGAKQLAKLQKKEEL